MNLENINARLLAAGYTPLDPEDSALFESTNPADAEQREAMLEDLEGRVLGSNAGHANQIAIAFARYLKDAMPPEDYAALVSRDKVSETSNANDYCDANQVLIEVFCNVMGREPYFATDIDEGNAIEAQVDADFELLEQAWAKAKRIWTA